MVGVAATKKGGGRGNHFVARAVHGSKRRDVDA